MMHLTQTTVQQLVDDIQIWTDFVDDFNLGSRICSPFRDDRKSSFGWFEHTSGSILYKDFGNGEIGNVFQYLQKLWGVSAESVLETISDFYSLPLSKRPKSFFDDTITNDIKIGRAHV